MEQSGPAFFHFFPPSFAIGKLTKPEELARLAGRSQKLEDLGGDPRPCDLVWAGGVVNKGSSLLASRIP